MARSTTSSRRWPHGSPGSGAGNGRGAGQVVARRVPQPGDLYQGANRSVTLASPAGCPHAVPGPRPRQGHGPQALEAALGHPGVRPAGAVGDSRSRRGYTQGYPSSSVASPCSRAGVNPGHVRARRPGRGMGAVFGMFHLNRLPRHNHPSSTRHGSSGPATIGSSSPSSEDPGSIPRPRPTCCARPALPASSG